MKLTKNQLELLIVSMMINYEEHSIIDAEHIKQEYHWHKKHDSLDSTLSDAANLVSTQHYDSYIQDAKNSISRNPDIEDLIS